MRNLKITVTAAGLAVGALLAGCTPVAGTGTADPSDIAAYQTTIASSRAAAAASARDAACTAWRTNMDTRRVATRATSDYTKNPNWEWDGIAPLVNAELAAIATESGKLPGVIATAQPNAQISALLTDYKGKLSAYADALRADAQARGSGDQTWPKRNPASSTLVTAMEALADACPGS